MLPQRTRVWLWRADGLLVLLALTVWGWALLGQHDTPAVALPDRSTSVEAEDQPLASVSFTELVALARPFHGWGERQEIQHPEPVAAPDGVLPLAALSCRAWIRYPGRPDLIVLKSKDPAHPEFYLPRIGRPDGGIAIEKIEPVGQMAHVSVRRGEETFTYRLRLQVRTMPGRVRIQPVRSTPVGGASDVRLAEAAAHGPVPVKLVPFFDSKGALLGARVTGVRPGSWLESAGLHAGDVVVGIGRDRVASVDSVRKQLHEAPGGGLSIEILRGLGREQKRLRLET